MRYCAKSAPIAFFEEGETSVPDAGSGLAVFEDPYGFDVTRSPNEHLGFGAGAHFCLGVNLARREMEVMFRELFQRLPDIEITGEPERLTNNFIHGIKHLPCRFSPGPLI